MGFPEESEDDKIFKELPADLRTRVASDFTRHLLDESDIFSCLSEGQKTRMCSYLHPVTVAAGHDLCRSGDEVSGLWLLQEGECSNPLPRLTVSTHFSLLRPGGLNRCQNFTFFFQPLLQ